MTTDAAKDAEIARLKAALLIAQIELMRCSHILAGDEALKDAKRIVSAALKETADER